MEVTIKHRLLIILIDEQSGSLIEGEGSSDWNNDFVPAASRKKAWLSSCLEKFWPRGHTENIYP